MKDSILSALILASRVNKGLGKSLTQRVIGEKADVVTKGDMEIGEKIIKTLLISKPQIVVESEEKGKESNLGPGEQERFYVAIDDIDGTNNLRVGNGLLPYCSMIVAFDGSKKTEAGYKYSDYTHAACIDYSTDKIFYTEKGLGKVEVYDTGWNKITDSSEIKQDNSNLALTLSTDAADEKGVFLFVAFTFAFCSSLVAFLVCRDGLMHGRAKVLYPAITGICFGGANLCNTILAGRMKSAVFFPVQNVSTILLSTLFGVVIFKEKITSKTVAIIILAIVVIVLFSL